MKKEEIVMIPFVAHESAMNRLERIIKLLICIIAIMFIGMMIYFYLPTEVVEDDVSQSVDNTTDSNISQTIGE